MFGEQLYLYTGTAPLAYACFPFFSLFIDAGEGVPAASFIYNAPCLGWFLCRIWVKHTHLMRE